MWIVNRSVEKLLAKADPDLLASSDQGRQRSQFRESDYIAQAADMERWFPDHAGIEPCSRVSGHWELMCEAP
jgi:hypothetical protein